LPSDYPKQLIVEGKNDLHVVNAFLKAYGVISSTRPFEITNLEGKDNILDQAKLLELIEQALVGAINVQGLTSIGIVLDADSDAVKRFEQIRYILSKYDLPPQLPSDGLLHRVDELQVGVWIMPDNQSPGNLESLLQTLIPPSGSSLWKHAQDATSIAKEQFEASFRLVDQPKAELHNWLAWQDPPGLPYGTAIKAKMLNVPNNKATAFVRWLDALYDLKIGFTSGL